MYLQRTFTCPQSQEMKASNQLELAPREREIHLLPHNNKRAFFLRRILPRESARLVYERDDRVYGSLPSFSFSGVPQHPQSLECFIINPGLDPGRPNKSVLCCVVRECMC